MASGDHLGGAGVDCPSGGWANLQTYHLTSPIFTLQWSLIFLGTAACLTVLTIAFFFLAATEPRKWAKANTTKAKDLHCINTITLPKQATIFPTNDKTQHC